MLINSDETTMALVKILKHEEATQNIKDLATSALEKSQAGREILARQERPASTVSSAVAVGAGHKEISY